MGVPHQIFETLTSCMCLHGGSTINTSNRAVGKLSSTHHKAICYKFEISSMRFSPDMRVSGQAFLRRRNCLDRLEKNILLLAIKKR